MLKIYVSWCNISIWWGFAICIQFAAWRYSKKHYVSGIKNLVGVPCLVFIDFSSWFSHFAFYFSNFCRWAWKFIFISSLHWYKAIELNDSWLICYVLFFYFQGTVLIKTADQLLNFSKEEEDEVERVSWIFIRIFLCKRFKVYTILSST